LSVERLVGLMKNQKGWAMYRPALFAWNSITDTTVMTG
jgi:hypothetical protein